MTALAEAAELSIRFAARESLTQSLGWAATLQRRGFACVFAGRNFLVMRAKDGKLEVKMQRPRVVDLGMIQAVATRAGAKRVLIEPARTVLRTNTAGQEARCSYSSDEHDQFVASWRAAGLEQARSIAHTKTVVVDLEGSEAALEARCSSLVRRNLRRARTADVDWRTTPFAEIDDSATEALALLGIEFYDERPGLDDDDFRTSLVRAYGEGGHLVTAWQGDRLLGAVYLLIWDGVASYYAAMCREPGYGLRVPTGLVWRCFELARAHRCELFDFVGVWDEREPERRASWRGFTAFKQRFGGQEIHFPPSFHLTVS